MMLRRRFLHSAALCLLLTSGGADAQVSGSTSRGGAGGGTPGGSAGQIQTNASGTFGGVTVNGDAALDTGTGAVTVTKTNGTPLGTGATNNSSGASGVVGSAVGGFTPGDFLVAKDIAGSYGDGGPVPFLNYRQGFQPSNDAVTAAALDFASGVATDSTGTVSLSFSNPAASTLTGSVTSGATSGAVASAVGLAPGLQVTIAGAGVSGANLTTYLTGVSGSTVTWKTATSTTVSGPAFTPTGVCVVDLTVAGPGGLDTGSVAAATSYHDFIIGGAAVPTTCMASASLTAPTATGYSRFRHIASVNTKSASAVPNVFTSFVNEAGGWDILFNTPIADASAVTISTAGASQTLGSIPTGIALEPKFSWLTISGSTTFFCNTPGTTDSSPLLAGAGFAIALVGMRTNTSGQLACKGASASFTFTILTRGYRIPLVP